MDIILLIPVIIGLILWGKKVVEHIKKGEDDLFLAATGICACLIAIGVLLLKIKI